MKLRHKPVAADGKKFEPGMEDGILGYCKGAHKQIFFDNMQKMRESPYFSKVISHVPCLLVKNHPVPLEEGSWIIDGEVVSQKEFDKNWEVVKMGRPKSEERATD